MSELVHLETDGAVGVIRLDRPSVNAINRAMHGEILAAAERADADPDIRAVVVYGGPQGVRGRRRHRGDGRDSGRTRSRSTAAR